MQSHAFREDVKLVLVATLATLVIYPVLVQASWAVSSLAFDTRFLEPDFHLKSFAARSTLKSVLHPGILIGLQVGLFLVLARCLLENLGWWERTDNLVFRSTARPGFRTLAAGLLALVFLGLGLVVFISVFQILLEPVYRDVAHSVSWVVLAVLAGLVFVTRGKGAGNPRVQELRTGNWSWAMGMAFVAGILLVPLLLLLRVAPGQWDKKEKLIGDWQKAQVVLDGNADYHRVHFDPDDNNEIVLGGTVTTPEIRDRLRKEMTRILGARNPGFFMVKVVWGDGT